VDLGTVGKWIAGVGLALMALGGLVWLAGRVGLPLGRLPGDFRMERGNFTLFLPCATTIILSLLVTVGINVLLRLLNR
jgi:hypothetical protein